MLPVGELTLIATRNRLQSIAFPAQMRGKGRSCHLPLKFRLKHIICQNDAGVPGVSPTPRSANGRGTDCSGTWLHLEGWTCIFTYTLWHAITFAYYLGVYVEFRPHPSCLILYSEGPTLIIERQKTKGSFLFFFSPLSALGEQVVLHQYTAVGAAEIHVSFIHFHSLW